MPVQSGPSDEVFDDYMQGGTEMTPSDTGVRPTKRLSDEEEVEEEEAEPAELEPTVELVVLCECGRFVCGERRGASGDANKPSTTASSRFGYRADVDGLRAISVIAVILYHMDATWLPGGFVGVDIFFCISGYVVTSSLLRPPSPPALSPPRRILAAAVQMRICS